VFGDHAAVEEFADAGVDASFERRASFRWGSDFEEAVAGMCAAAALARLVDGVVFDEAEDKLLTVDEAIALARQNLATLAQPKPAERMGTRPADIKRYLEPLLRQRDDLVLIGRMLVIRPVRHLVRGVFFGRRGHPHLFDITRSVDSPFLSRRGPYIDPVSLGGAPRSRRGDEIYARPVWDPLFQTLLFDTLAEDVFEDVGALTTLDDFERRLERDSATTGRVQTLVAMGQPERARQLVDEIERSQEDRTSWQQWATEQRAFLERDIASICAEFHTREAQGMKELKLERIWEPAPFPVEAPATERATRCAERPFATTPWAPRPPGLAQEMPERPGEIRFARESHARMDRRVLRLPLTREQAEEAHRLRENYVFATRLPDGGLLTLDHSTGWSSHDPLVRKDPGFVPPRELFLTIGGFPDVLLVDFKEDWDERGAMKMFMVRIIDAKSGNWKWNAFNDVKRRQKGIRRYNGRKDHYEDRPMSESDVALCRFDEPPFGEFNDLLQRACRFLQNEGYGPYPLTTRT
jgi:hypothetical protein